MFIGRRAPGRQARNLRIGRSEDRPPYGRARLRARSQNWVDSEPSGLKTLVTNSHVLPVIEGAEFSKDAMYEQYHSVPTSRDTLWRFPYVRSNGNGHGRASSPFGKARLYDRRCFAGARGRRPAAAATPRTGKSHALDFCCFDAIVILGVPSTRSR